MYNAMFSIILLAVSTYAQVYPGKTNTEGSYTLL